MGGGPTDAKEIKGHAFFENISWDELEQKKVRKRGRHKLFVFRIWDIFYAFLMIHTLQNSKKKANEILDSTNTNIKIQNEGSKKY